jgi:hypothetical protein
MAMILILPRSKGDGWYADVLGQRGHRVVMQHDAAEHQLVIDEHMAQYDGCLLLGTSDDLMAVANRFQELRKPVYRHLAEVPRDQNSEGPPMPPPMPAPLNEPPADAWSTADATEHDRDGIQISSPSDPSHPRTVGEKGKKVVEWSIQVRRGLVDLGMKVKK